MDVIEKGDKIKLIFDAKLEDGTLCYKNDKENPLEFIVGEGKIFSAVEKKLMDMKVGEKKEITLEPKDTFGQYYNDLIAEIPKKNLNVDTTFEIGCRVQMKTNNDKLVKGVVTEIKDNAIIVDFNHPLAGKNIIFTLYVLSIEKN